MTLPELYNNTRSKLKELEQTMPDSYADLLGALFLVRLCQRVMATIVNTIGDSNEKMEILALPSDTDRDNGSNP